LRRKD